MKILAAILLSASLVSAADDKDREIMELKKLLAEQTLGQLLEYEKVKEYARIKANYDRLLEQIAEHEKKQKIGEKLK